MEAKAGRACGRGEWHHFVKEGVALGSSCKKGDGTEGYEEKEKEERERERQQNVEEDELATLRPTSNNDDDNDA